ncbi:MAG: hypothetical protein AAGH60_02085 [Pseudomonadota bacterium]
MTCIAVANFGFGLVFACDGAGGYPETGELTGTNMNKIYQQPHLHAAFAFAGMGMMGAYYQAILDKRGYDDFDELADNMVEDVETAHQHLMWDTNGPLAEHTEITVMAGGWSPRDEAYKAYQVTSFEKDRFYEGNSEPEKIQPYTLLPFTGYAWTSCSVPTEIAEEFQLHSGHIKDFYDPNEAVRYLGRHICAARAGANRRDPDTGHVQFAGAMVQFCVLTGGQIQSWIAHRWLEDEIGQPIDPSKGLRMPDFFKADYEQPAA